MGTKENIKKLRELYGLTQADLGKIAGVTDKAVSTWEAGIKEPRMGALQRIADHFGLQKSNIIEDRGLDNEFTPSMGAVITLSSTELEHIKKYRRIDSDGRATIDMMLDQLVKAAEAEESNQRPAMVTLPLASRGEGLGETKITQKAYEEVVEMAESLKSDDLDL